MSFLLTSESMIIAGGDKWDDWNEKMLKLMQKIQNEDGSWSGHHCITSPVFCTAAVIQCLTVESDSEMLREIAKKNAKQNAKPKVKTTESSPTESSAENSDPKRSDPKVGDAEVESGSKAETKPSADKDRNSTNDVSKSEKDSAGRQ